MQRTHRFIFTLALLFGPMLAWAANPVVELNTTDGKITLELDAQKAPASVANFLGYVRSGFYDGTIFHRVIKGFMIQGGGFSEDMQKKPGLEKPIENEAANGLKNVRGTIAMARTNAPHSATSQFFINVVDNAMLNHTAPSGRGWGYAVFGKVTGGMDVVDKIRDRKVTRKGIHQNVPVAPAVIISASVVGDKPETTEQ